VAQCILLLLTLTFSLVAHGCRYAAESTDSTSPHRVWSHANYLIQSHCGADAYNKRIIVCPEQGPCNGTSITVTGYLVTNGCFGSAAAGNSCPFYSRLGVLAHEMGHTKIHGAPPLMCIPIFTKFQRGWRDKF
jgi:hypothetical protein